MVKQAGISMPISRSNQLPVINVNMDLLSSSMHSLKLQSFSYVTMVFRFSRNGKCDKKRKKTMIMLFSCFVSIRRIFSWSVYRSLNHGRYLVWTENHFYAERLGYRESFFYPFWKAIYNIKQSSSFESGLHKTWFITVCFCWSLIWVRIYVIVLLITFCTK